MASMAVSTVAKAGDHDHQDAGVFLLDAPQHLHAVHAGHLQVQQHDMDFFTGQDGQPLFAVGGPENGAAHAGEDALGSVADAGFIVDDQDSDGVGVSFQGLPPRRPSG
jgi:hypothetical protein